MATQASMRRECSTSSLTLGGMQIETTCTTSSPVMFQVNDCAAGAARGFPKSTCQRSRSGVDVVRGHHRGRRMRGCGSSEDHDRHTFAAGDAIRVCPGVLNVDSDEWHEPCWDAGFHEREDCARLHSMIGLKPVGGSGVPVVGTGGDE
jgi:hypothetical protein